MRTRSECGNGRPDHQPKREPGLLQRPLAPEARRSGALDAIAAYAARLAGVAHARIELDDERDGGGTTVSLVADGSEVGRLVVTGGTVDADRLARIAPPVAAAVRALRAIDAQKHELLAQARLVRGLREQAQAHTTRLRTMADLLDVGDVGAARRFVSDVRIEHHELCASVVERIDDRVVASLLLGEINVARRRGARLHIDARSELERLPERLGDAEAVSIIGNLLDNALDAVEGLPRERRRVTLLIRRGATSTVIRVRDWGVGLPAARDDLLVRHGFTTKPDHAGAGLHLVARLTAAAGGRIEIARRPVGTVISVTVPNG